MLIFFLFKILQDENGEWYYDDRSSSAYEGWIQDENGEWIEDPNYYETGADSAETGTGKTEQTQKSVTGTNNQNKTKSAAETAGSAVIKNQDHPETSGKVNGDVKNLQTIKKDDINGATSAATVVVSDANGANATEKLPPRPADYDYYWYQDEDGNWRNEYDDYG